MLGVNSRRFLAMGVDVFWILKEAWDSLDGVETEIPGDELSSISVVKSNLSASGRSFCVSSVTFWRDWLMTECK